MSELASEHECMSANSFDGGFMRNMNGLVDW